MSRLPRWLKRRVPKGNADHFTQNLLETLHVETVCQHAKCPNRMECYARKTATFLLMGPVCTRNCRFCSVETGVPKPVDESEPHRIAEAVKRLELSHVVLTCVSRDDLEDGGAEWFCRTIEAIRDICTKTGSVTTVEVLPSDFAGNGDAVDCLADMLPEVYNYNTETVPRLFRTVRGPIPDFDRTLEIFRRIRNRQPTVRLKSGLMLGLGETDGEVVDVLRQLRAAGCDAVTIGQYLQPNSDCISVDRYVTPEQFERFGEIATEIGFASATSAPFVRSSYHARPIE